MVVWTVVCMLILTLVSDGMNSCMYVNIYVVIWWYGQLYINMLIYTLVSGGMDSCMLIYTLISGGIDGCVYVNMYIVI